MRFRHVPTCTIEQLPPDCLRIAARNRGSLGWIGREIEEHVLASREIDDNFVVSLSYCQNSGTNSAVATEWIGTSLNALSNHRAVE